MFLLFKMRCSGYSGSDPIYIPICFYYFPLPIMTSIFGKRFTFQYVSIICTCASSNPFDEYHLHSNMFLLFRETRRGFMCKTHLHSNMFLLFEILRDLYSALINLHSNMFLLFCIFFKAVMSFNKIYIPICFYYFEMQH